MIINNDCTAYLICDFCDEDDIYSLSINKDGSFECRECGESGLIDDFPDLKNKYLTLRARLAEKFGQLRLPGIK